jgi:peptidoglycan/LPS O-acetylase OafA/YrhL
MDSAIPTTAASPHQERLENIEALRGLAVLAVMLFHYTAGHSPDFLRFTDPVQRVTYGFMGVELFFVISGYCIYMTAARCSSVAAFWARRFSRLQPAFMASILLTFLLVRYFQLPDRQVDVVAAVANVFWLPAFQLSPAVDGVYWSLMVELKLYFLFGLVYFGLRKRGDPLVWWTVLLLAGAVIRSFDVHFNDAQFSGSTYTIGTFAFPYSGFFLLGMLFYRWDSTPLWLKLLAMLAYAWACIATGATWTERAIFFALLPLCKFVFDWKQLRVPAPLLYLGFISYPLYLLHNNIGVIVLRETAAAIPSEYARILLASAVSISLAALISVTVEHRFRRSFERPLERALSFVTGLPSRFRAAPAHP